MNELVISWKNLLKMQAQCDASLLNEVFDEVRVITTYYSNFWDVTSFFHTQTKVNLIDKIQIVSFFIMLGGRVELDSHIHDFVDWQHLWNYMYEHRYISKEDYDFLCGYWISDGKIRKRT